MATLITTAQAKYQLRIHEDDHDHDDDIDMKVKQATDIVLDYLQSRVHRRAVIVSSSVASPTVITTDEAHGYANGDEVIIADHVDSTPALVGTYTISDVTEKSFTVPVAITVAGSGGSAVVEWTPTTVPERVRWAVLQTLEDLYEHRTLNVKFLEWTLARSRNLAIA